MANFLTKAKIKTGVSAHSNRFTWHPTTVTTQDFYKPKCVYTRELMPNQSIEVNMEIVSKTTKIVKPFYGSCKILTRAFFVPFRTVMEGFNDYIVDTPHTWGDGTISPITRVPIVGNDTLVSAFTTSTTFSEQVTEEIGADFSTYFSNITRHYKLTEVGRIFFDILTSLGYKLTTFPITNTQFSALPLLCWAKVHYDWFANPAYANHFAVSKYFKGKQTSLNATDVQTILLNSYRIMLQSDMFTSAWDNPVSPNSGNGANLSSAIELKDPTNTSTNYYGGKISALNSNAPGDNFTQTTPNISIQNGNSIVRGSVTQWMIDALHKVTDYVMLHRLAGSRTLDRYMADWGIQLDSAKLDRSLYLGKNDTLVDIGQVMQTSGDDGGLGNYAAAGNANGGDNFRYKAEEFGLFMIVSWVVPNFMNIDGRSKFIRHGVQERFDFFTPKFDNLGNVPVEFQELSTNTVAIDKSELDSLPSESETFGYQPRYYEYCVDNDMLLGDFLLGSKNTMLESWYLARRYNYKAIVDNSLSTKHDYEFTLADGADFTNIFPTEDQEEDHFITKFQFHITSYMPKKSLFDTYDFEDDGRKLLISLNGTTLE